MKNENIEDARPLARFPALITYKGLTGNIFIQGAEFAYLRYAGITASFGKAFIEEDLSNGNEVMPSPAVLKLFGVEDPESFIGQEVTFRLLVPAEDGSDLITEINIEEKYRVKGITKEEGVLNVLMMLPELRTCGD